MKWDTTNEELVQRLKNFNSDQFFILWQQHRKDYESRLSALDESRRSKNSNSNIGSNMELDSDV